MSDLIDRQMVIDAIEEMQMPIMRSGSPIDQSVFTGMGRALQAIKALPSAQPQWIPCSERLPVDDDYRESMECLDGCVWYFTDKGLMGLGYYYYSTKEWSTLRDLKPDGKVIAWMPLPEPYGGESE